MTELYADVIPGISHKELDKTFQYKVPEDLADQAVPGAFVKVPFGRGNKTINGFIVQLGSEPEIEKDKIKEIIEICSDKDLPESRMIDLAHWMKDEYDTTMIRALKTVLPVQEAVRSRKSRVQLGVGDFSKEKDITLNPEQKMFCRDVIADWDKGVKDTYLLHGITGSGKTLCYMEIISHITEKGQSAIMLIPEISLTWQTVGRFKERFGERISIINSRMSKGERFDEFKKCASGEVDIVIGPRSALFAPFKKIGIIIIDEEHEESYKSEQAPRYHAREVAGYIAKKEGASLILGSATPSIKSYHRAKNGDIRLYTLTKRASRAPLPRVFVEDMREELKAGNRQMFSRKLLEALRIRLEKKEQSMLFINKRGFAGFVSCRACGHVLKCKNCDISMTYHRGFGLRCHYCGYSEPMVKKCPKCGSPHIAGFKAGTQQVEDKLKSLFPEARICRMDKDTTSSKDGHSAILSEFAEGKADILVGTQMIVKGHDFENVTLCCALAADMSLYVGDYRASERTFDLLTQAAGRSGRAGKPGEVIIQTYDPDNYCIIHSAAHDYEGFYNSEIEYRRLLLYPPIWNMMTIGISSSDEEALNRTCDRLSDSDIIKALKERKEEAMVIGPSKESVYRMENEYRMVMYIKSKEKGILKGVRKKLENICEDKVYIHFDTDLK